MHEKLVSNLRERAAWISLPHHGEEYPSADSKLMTDAADAIEELSAHYCPHAIRNVHDRGDDSLCRVLMREVPKWIPVTERLPEEYTRVIGFMAWKAMTAIEHQNGKWYSIDHLEPLPDEAVTHWMPLPEPPKEE